MQDRKKIYSEQLLQIHTDSKKRNPGKEVYATGYVIELKKDCSRNRVELEHTNIPDEVFEEIVEGWKEYYLGSIKGLLEMY